MLDHKKIAGILLTLSILLVLVGYIFVSPEKVGICETSDFDCMLSYPSRTVGEPLYWGGLALAIVSGVLVFVRGEVFKTWAKFAVPYIAISFIILASGITEEGFFSPGRELVSQLLGILYVVLSVLVILGKYAVLRFRSRT